MSEVINIDIYSNVRSEQGLSLREIKLKDFLQRQKVNSFFFFSMKRRPPVK